MISFRLNIFVAILSPLKCPLNQVCYLYNCSSIVIRNDISYSCICWGRARCPRTLLFLNVCLANLNVRVMHKKKFKGQLKPVFYGIWLVTWFIKGPSYILNNILIPRRLSFNIHKNKYICFVIYQQFDISSERFFL